MIRRPPRSTLSSSSAASDVYKRQARSMASTYDLSYQVGQFLDSHLVMPILDFLDEEKVYSDPADATKSSPELLAGKAELLNRRQTCNDQTAEQAKQQCAGMIALLQDQETVKQLRTEKLFTAQHLQEAHQIEPEHIEALYVWGKKQFDCGQYQEAADALAHYFLVGQEEPNKLSALWGKLACEILIGNWETASEDLSRLRDTIDAKTTLTHLEQLQQRSWLIHWSLFVFLKCPSVERGRSGLIDLCFTDRYLNTIQTNCPHLLRYLTCALICTKRRRSTLKDLIKVIQQEHYTFSDPVTKFLECLYVDFDFDQAQVQLGECEVAIANDYFLHGMREEFVENARVFIFETYCRIHRKIDIGMLGQKLNMQDAVEAENWIVNLIRDASLDAKIESGHVVMGTQHAGVYETIIAQTKGLAYRSGVMANAVGQRLSAAGYGNAKMSEGGYGMDDANTTA
eukprot:TRINITY_DN4790_c0_g1_i11.p1 TRINITY_DN4790_c0_g1~~TRINITY_DN4790_c0_g1_i11.p1  ORF type:complete len:456 (-),score=136.28 TRINITY_DN4790_c0_g1_i11:330-1697(-)